MHVSRSSIEIARPPEVVFDYVTTPRNWPAFWPLTLSVEGDVDQPLRVGHRCIEQARILGWRGAFHWEVVEAAPPTRLVVRGYSKQAGVMGAVAPENPSQITYRLTPTAAGTRFDREMAYADASLLVKFADWLGFGRDVDRLTAIAMRALIAILENRLLAAPSVDPLAADLLTEADPLGDAAVATLVSATGDLSAVRRLLVQIAEGAVDAGSFPGSGLGDFLDRTSVLPSWSDPDRIAIAEDLFMDWGLVTIASLACASLPETYCVPDIARLLNATRQLDASRSHVHRRLIFTTRMVFDVMRRGGMAPGGPGIHAVQRVRLLHAIIRLLIREREARPAASSAGAAKGDAPGVPINQMELAYVLQTFAFVTLRSLDRFNCELTPFQRDSFLHTWNVVGSLLGIRPDLLPATVAAAQRQFETLHARYARRSPDGTRLAAALVPFWADLFPFGTRWCARRLMHVMLTTMLPPPTREMLDLPHLPSFPRGALFVVDTIGRLSTNLSGRAFADMPPMAWAAARLMQLGLTFATRGDDTKSGLWDIPAHLAGRSAEVR